MSLYDSILGLSERMMTDTCRYIRRYDNFSRFKESKSEFVEDIFEVTNCLIIPNSQSNTEKDREGSVDFVGGYIFLHSKIFLNLGLIDSNGNLTAQDNTDFVEFNGVRYEVTKVTLSNWDWVAKKNITIRINYKQFLNTN
jgi:hypothetical protein